ncbi:ABC transporter ATP-binding protein [Stutzerimonas kirkiae]|uniref:ABC-type dipeptide transporter n=1 Tax=Stutzerimonas kirkiae TaxID=2211392 RepID=A0A4Q9RF67_9GAMM|nr:ABC transporter ATP-binding protein [Stutzerimonas kirkiae]TBU98961.1 ABC transporter ATP-binding protein [Stutzerimonas kirkiae]TBV01611.1 ABC transporter ATP-binding protein [Stutzerimonas kirkiae]
MSDTLLEISGLSIDYLGADGPQPGVREIDLRLRRGEFVAIVGESGSGKSTTAAALIGLLAGNARISAGHIDFEGQALQDLDEHHWRHLRGNRIGFVPQDPGLSLDPVKRIGAQLIEAMRIHGVARTGARQRSLELLRQVGLRDVERLARRYPHELSGGMRQRVLIAIALANEPALIIADEPTSALDVTVQRQVLDHLQRLARKRQIAVLLITHDLGVAMDRAERVIVMRQGRIVERGSTREIFLRPRHPYTRRLLEAAPSLAQATASERRPRLAGPALLSVSGLGKQFAHGHERLPPAVADVSFEVPRGGTLSLVGESGSGKSTTARMILRLERPSSGSIRFDGEDILAYDAARLRDYRRRVQVVYQNPYASLDPRFTLAQIITEPLRAFAVGDRASQQQQAARLLERVGLPAKSLYSHPGQLSGGQRQRVAIARALALEPELLVLDEPLSALDASVQKQILELLAELQRELGLSYLFISHDLAVVRQISDRVVVMQAGRVVEQGDSERLFEAPASDYTRRLLSDVPGQRYLDSLNFLVAI